MSDVTINRHLFLASIALKRAAGTAIDVSLDCIREMIDSPDARDYVRAQIERIEKQVAEARRHLDLYAAGEADKDAAVDGAVDRLTTALSGKCPDCGEPNTNGGLLHVGCRGVRP